MILLKFSSKNKRSYIQSGQGGKVNILGGHSIGHSKKKTLYEHVSYSERFPIFGAQYFPSLPLYEQSQQPTDAWQWRITVGGKENIARQIRNIGRQISETIWNRIHVHINFFLRMINIMTSQNNDLSSWDTLYNSAGSGYWQTLKDLNLKEFLKFNYESC
jgi:hypothetical protein